MPTSNICLPHEIVDEKKKIVELDVDAAMKENMLDENKEKGTAKGSKQPDDILMKPFNLGWTREVVKRVITKNRTPNCDIYYFSPDGKRIRSLTEIKSNLTDGLTPECFSFKREPLGLSETYETIRSARIRGKTDEKAKPIISSRRKTKVEKLEDGIESDLRDIRRGSRMENLDAKTDGGVKKEDNLHLHNGSEEKKELSHGRRIKKEEIESQEMTSYSGKSKEKTKDGKMVKGRQSLRAQIVKKRKAVLKKVMSAKQIKQTKVGSGKKILKKIVRKKVERSPKQALAKKKDRKETDLKTKNSKKKNTSVFKKVKKPLKHNQRKNKGEQTKDETNNSDSNENDGPRDLKSIVQKNIGKYREMRERQKLGALKSQVQNQKKNSGGGNVIKARSEPISKNKQFYLKPLEKGWRRELVYRTNCARAGQQADVYYFHPNGKKLRSCREIAENLTHGLSMECFTFRKEPLGCGEPSEVIRNARSHQKPVQSSNTSKRKETE